MVTQSDQRILQGALKPRFLHTQARAGDGGGREAAAGTIANALGVLGGREASIPPVLHSASGLMPLRYAI